MDVCSLKHTQQAGIEGQLDVRLVIAEHFDQLVVLLSVLEIVEPVAHLRDRIMRFASCTLHHTDHSTSKREERIRTKDSSCDLLHTNCIDAHRDNTDVVQSTVVYAVFVRSEPSTLSAQYGTLSLQRTERQTHSYAPARSHTHSPRYDFKSSSTGESIGTPNLSAAFRMTNEQPRERRRNGQHGE